MLSAEWGRHMAPETYGSAGGPDRLHPDAVLCLRDRSVLVTGARGFIGSHLVRRLSETGAELHAVTRQQHEVSGKVGLDRVTWHRLDVSDASATSTLVRSVRPDVIFHLASTVVGRREAGLVVPILHSNFSSAVSLMTAGLETGVSRIVLAGSMEEPDPAEPEAVPNSPYSAAKWAATTYARMFCQLWNLPITVLRIAMAYGPAQADMEKLVPYVISSFLEGRAPALTSGGRLIDWVYVDDVVDALLRAAASQRSIGEVIPIGSGVAVPIREVVETIHALVVSDRIPDSVLATTAAAAGAARMAGRDRAA